MRAADTTSDAETERDAAAAGLDQVRELLGRTWALNRSLANEDFDRTLAEIGRALPGMEVHSFHSGEQVLDWIVPERWELRSARVTDSRGNVVLDAAGQPLHVVSYSLPFSGVVGREELLEHLHTDPENPDVIPYRYAFYERDWGLCTSERVRESLQGDRFEVELDTELRDGTLNVGELVLEGERTESVLFIGHIDHPMQVNDGLLGALVLVELARRLSERTNRRWTYRFLFVPERIGTTAWVDRHLDLMPELLGGVFCEMPGVRDQLLSVQTSKWGDTKFDRVLAKLAREAEPGAPVLPCWKHVVNDEGVMNSPGVDVPVASLSRSAPNGPFEHFPEYHTDRDTPEIVDWDGVGRTLAVLERFYEVMERDTVPEPRYAGDPFLSRHGLWVDWREDPILNVAIEDIHHAIDGRTSSFDIAERLQVPFETVDGFVRRMADRGLVELGLADRFYSAANGWSDRAARKLPEGKRQAGTSQAGR